MKYKCPICHESSTYHSKNKKSNQLPSRIRTNCKFCKNDIDITSQSKSSGSSQKREDNLPPTSSLPKKGTKFTKNQSITSIQTKNTHDGSEAETLFSANSRNKKNDDKIESVGTKIKQPTSKTQSQESKSNEMNDKNLKSNSSNESTNENHTKINKSESRTWRIHLIRWSIEIKSFHPTIQFEKEINMKSYMSQYLTIENCIVEIHTKCNQPKAILNIPHEYYEKKPDAQKTVGLQEAIQIIAQLKTVGIDCDVDSLERLQSNHNAHSLEKTKYVDSYHASAKGQFGTCLIDYSEGINEPPEIEVKDDEQFANDGQGLCNIVAHLPELLSQLYQNLKSVEKISLHNTSQLNALIELLVKSQPTPDKNPITKPKGDFNGIFI